ncbi:MAG TPA: SRPBCC family protein [Thermoleophilaceae bacterium]|nr:SRPBCC family protein [Thermoleophilaceae bacterium]
MLQHVEVTGVHADVSADEAFEVLRELDRHVHEGEVILSLRLDEDAGGTRVSHWETRFRNGILRWSQRDVLDADARTMTFALSEGDAETLEGQWRIEPAEVGCRIHFACDFDLGIPSLSEFLDPVAVRLLRETVEAQLTDIFGPDLRVLRPVEPGV